VLCVTVSVHIMHTTPAGMVIQRWFSHPLLVTVLMPRALRLGRVHYWLCTRKIARVQRNNRQERPLNMMERVAGFVCYK